MRKLIYGNAGTEIEIEDRALTHLQIVIGAKLRRRESFFFSWKEDSPAGHGRASLWLDPGIPLFFKYYGSRTPTINKEWIELLAHSANSGRGLVCIDEPVEAPHHATVQLA